MARMELPVLDKFCFFVDLKKGCIIMGAFNAISAFVLALMLIMYSLELNDLVDSIPATRRDEFKEEISMSSIVSFLIVVQIIILAIKCICDTVFVYAVYKERAPIIRRYYVFWIAFVIIYVICFLKSMFHMSAGNVIGQIFLLAQNFYYIIVIRSYLISINEDGMM